MMRTFHYRPSGTSVILGLLSFSLAAWGDEPPLPAKIEFNRDVRPILSDNCFSCHGPDQGHRKGKLRLDIREAALEKEAFVPGNPDASELVARLVSEDEEELMPPPDSHKILNTRQKEILRQWIAQGAEYQQHWAYEPPVKPEVTAGQNPVDALVGKRLAEMELKAAPEASRRTLIRRLHADLLGLPPTPEEVAAFVNDTSPDAYGKLVDRILANPHYGERMALGWLDVVRFADTVGYHSDNGRNVYPYRDYVIKSFNANKPFDRFTLEQIAGDLLPDATLETRVGSAFNRLLLSTEEGGAQPKDYEARMLTDRVRAIGAVWMGQTTGCAQCHDHKFDPFTTRDFYSLGAFFADIEEPILGRREEGITVPDEAQAAELAKRQAEVTRLEGQFQVNTPEGEAAFQKWQQDALQSHQQNAAWQALKPESVSSREGAKLAIQPDLSILAGGKAPGTDIYTLTFKGPLKDVAGLRLEVLPDPSLPAQGPGRASNGNFVVSEITATVSGGSRSDPAPIAFSRAKATMEQTIAGENHPDKAWSAASTIDGDSRGATWGWAILPEAGKPQQLLLELAAPLQVADQEILTIEIRQNHDNKGHTLGKFRLSTSNDSQALKLLPPPSLPPEIANILVMEKEKRNQEQQNKVLAHFKSIAPELAGLRQELAGAIKARTDLEASFGRCLVSVSTPNKRTVRILPRGNWMDETGEVMKPAFPHYLPQPKIEGREPNRLDLAQWLVSPENPLTARVVMNRLWKQFFGMGLSKVLDDLGAQGEPPVNPPLLDWLACEFRDSGWNMKHMVRLIVTSATYKQSSLTTPELAANDPYNREHARQSSFRLDAELVRDNALAISGLLVTKIGGPSVKPYQPDGYWENLNFPVRTYQPDTNENQWRRGLYTWWQRSYLHPSLLAFDAPTREECAADRTRSNIPQQALVLLNDPTYVEAARSFGLRILKECQGTPEQRVQWAWQQALQRDPTPEESQALLELFGTHLADYKADPKAAGELLKTGLAPVPADTDPSELAAWTHVARVLLNLHETITRN